MRYTLAGLPEPTRNNSLATLFTVLDSLHIGCYMSPPCGQGDVTRI